MRSLYCCVTMRRLLLVMGLTLAAQAAVAKDLLCDQCRRPIKGTYTIFNGLKLHDACFKRYHAEYCAVCGGMLSGEYAIFQDQSMHDSCYYKRFAQYCGICERELLGEYLFNSWGDTVHASHADEFPACDYCNRLKAEQLTGRGIRYHDAREVCGVCYATAVTKMGDAEALLDTVLTRLRLNGIAIDHKFELDLIDRNEMSRLNSEAGREAWGFTNLRQQRQYFGLVKTSKIKVYVLSGMPRDYLVGVLAHELMHVWLFTNSPLENDPALNEGSCEYAAYLALRVRRTQHAEYYLESQLANEDPIYGDGFRSVLSWAQSVGVDGWLTYLRLYKDPPWK